jgi:predicted thioesterase
MPTMSGETAAQNAGADGIGSSLTAKYTVHDKDTVGYLVPGMPMVAATPSLVTVAEMVCYEICKKQIEPGQVTVGVHVEIDHLGASKVGAELVVDATLRARERNRFTFDVTVTDGERTVAKVVHMRAAVSAQKMMAALG